MEFWSLCRSGLWPVSGRASWRAFRAAVASCGLPRFFVSLDRDAPVRGSRLLLSANAEFSSGRLFRCRFSASVPVPEWFLCVRALWLLPVRVTEFREDPFVPAPSRWVAFREALASSFDPRYL